MAEYWTADRFICALTLILVFYPQESQSKVTEALQSQVSLINSSATFTCAGTGEDKLQIVNGSQVLLSLQFDDTLVPKYYPQQKINVTRTIDSADVKTYKIVIYTEIENNNTEIYCSFHDDEKGFTNATLCIAKDVLGDVDGFQTPTVTYSASSAALQVSWSAPWSHLVNSYTVTTNNLSDNSWVEYQVTDERTLSLKNTMVTSTSGCHSIMVFVTAHTDVGDAQSNIIATGVPIEIGTISKENINIQLLMKKSGTFLVDLSFNASTHCSAFQEVMYNFTMYRVDQQSTKVHVGPTTTPRVLLEGIVKDVEYCVEVVYWDDTLLTAEEERKNVTKCFHFPSDESSSAVESRSSTETPTVTIAHTTTTKTVTPTTCNSVIYESSSSIPLYVVAAVGSALFILLTVCVLVIIVILLKTRSKRIPTINGDVIAPVVESKDPSISKVEDTNLTCAHKMSTVKKTRKNSVPQMMATNPLYEAGTCSSVYSTVPEPLRGVRANNRRPSEVALLGIPPQLPPPRKMSLDSPGIKAGVQLSLDKQMFLEGNDTIDQYVSMQSASDLRYAKSPLMKSKMIYEDPCEINGDLHEENNKEEKV